LNRTLTASPRSSPSSSAGIDYTLAVDVEPDTTGFREKLAADLEGLDPGTR